MSISSIIATGNSALSVSQTQISITATNISNSGTDGYTKKSADVTTSVVGGVATGVQIVGVGNDIDNNLHASVVDAMSQASYDQTLAAYLETVVSAFGSTSDGSALSTTLTTLDAALSAAIADPNGVSSKSAVIDAINDWAKSVNDVSASIQSTRTTADQSIEENVESINALLNQIDGLNDEIAKAKANGDSTADLKDVRRTAEENLAKYIDVQTFTTSSDEMQIYTTSGKALLTSAVHELTYTSSGDLNAENTYKSNGSGSIPGILLDGKDITNKLSGGSLGALIELRDTILPNRQTDLNILAKTITATLNAASNAATPTPVPTSLTSSETYQGTDTFIGSGTMTLLQTDSDGTITASDDIDLSTCNTIQDVINAIDSISGMSATLNANGELEVTADDGTSGLIVAGDGKAGADNFGASQYFGFNNVISSSDGNLQTSDALSTSGLPMASITSTSVGDAAYVSGDTSGLQGVWSALNGNMSFPAGGNLSATDISATSYTSALIDDLSDRSAIAANTATSSATTATSLASSFINSTGVNVDEETALLTTYQQNYQAATQILTTAQDMWDSLLTMMR